MGKGTIGGKIVLEGEKTYRDALKNIKSGQAELRSEMKLCASQFKESQNTLEALSKKHEILTKQVDMQKQKIDVYRDAMTAWNKAGEDAAQKTEDLRTALEVANKEMDEMSGASEENAEAVEKQQKKIDELSKKLTLAEEMCTKAAQKTQSYATAANNAEAELNGMESELDKTSKQMQEAEKTTDKCATSIDAYGKETQEATEKTNIFGDVLKANLASEAIISGIKAIADGIKTAADSAVDVGTSFEAAMSEVAATMGMTAEEINAGSQDYTRLADAAKACGAATKFSASEAAEALNYLALAGYDVDKSVATLPKVLDLAAAGGLDLAYASDLVTDSMAALGMETSELDNYIDEMAKTSQKSNTNVAQLGEATLVCAGTVSLTGQKLETMNAELGVLANNGIKGSEGGTHLRNVLLSLSAPTDNAAEAIEKLGLRIYDSNGSMRDLNNIMADMDWMLGSMSQDEKTRIISKIFNKTDIAAVNALLKGTGAEYDNLYDQINNCAGAAANMAETMNNNLKGDVVILQSALEGLGIASYEIFDDTMRRSVQAATDAVSRLTKSIERGNLGVSLNKMARSLGEFSEKALDVGEDALPVVIDGLTWMLDNADMVASLVTAIGAAHIEMAVAPKIIEGCSAAWEAYQLVSQGAATWQEALNVAMAANPAGLLVTAITALTAGVAAYCIINKDNLTQLSETTQATKDLVEQTRALNDETQKSFDTAKQNVSDLESQEKVAKDLAGELEELKNKTARTTTEQTRMKMIVDELNTIVPDLNLHYNEQNNTLNMTQKEIEGCVDSYMELYRAQAIQEELQDIAKKQIEYEQQLHDLGKQRESQVEEQEAAEEALAEARERHNDLMASGVGHMVVYDKTLADAVLRDNEARDALENLDATIKETEESNQALSDEYEYWMEIVGNTENLDNATATTGELGDAAQETGEHITSMGNDVSAAYKEMYDNVFETIEKQLSLFSKFNSESELTASELLNNMQSQVDGISQWADNMESLASRTISETGETINQGLLQYLAEMGPEGAGYVASFVSMTDEELQKANELWEESLTLKTDTTDRIMEAWQKAGENAVEGYKTGMDDKAEEVEESAEDMVQGGIDAGNKAQDSHSPSKKYAEMGMYAVEGYAEGVRDNKQTAIDAMSAVCEEIIAKARSVLKKETFYEYGKLVAQGLADGIKDGKSEVVSAIEDMCTEAIKKAKSTLKINSPSKAFEYLGEMSGEGYIKGWSETMANTSLIEVCRSPVAAVQQTVKQPAPSSDRVVVYQDIKVYGEQTNEIELARRFKQEQQEVAREW